MKHIIKEVATKFVKNSDASEIAKSIRQSMVDQCLYKSFMPSLLTILVGTTIYIALVIHEHTILLHVWIILFDLYYSARILFYFLYFKTNILPKRIMQKRFSSLSIMLWGLGAGLIWAFFLLVLFIQDYPLQSQLIGVWTFSFFTSVITLRYTFAPLWYLCYISVITIPVVLWLFLQDTSYILTGLCVLVFSIYTAVAAYTYFNIVFGSFYFQLQNKKMRLNLEKVNKALQLEIQRRQKVEARLSKSATHDKLTKVPNRILLQDRLNQAILSSKRKENSCGLLFIDLDGFKPINDKFGHEMGDKVLQSVAKRIKSSIRAEDTIARIGGDEFVVLIVNLGDEQAIKPIAQKITKILSAPYTIENNSFICKASVGVALFPSGGSTARELLKNADRAMYLAKNAGGARFDFFIP